MTMSIGQEVVVRRVQQLVDRCSTLQRKADDLTAANGALLNKVADLYDTIDQARQRGTQAQALLREIAQRGGEGLELHERIQAALDGDL